MAGAGTEVGRISIKVTPDTDGFRNELRRQLKAIEKSIKGEVPIHANVNAGLAQAQMRGVMAKLRGEAARGVEIPVRIDKRRAFTEAQNGFASLGAAFKDARNGLSAYIREVKRLTLEQQKASPLLNHDLAVLRSQNVMRQRGAAYLREFSAALKDQQKWLRDANPALTEAQAKWKSWGMAIRDANNNATNAVRSFKSAFKALGDGDAKGFASNIRNALGTVGKEAESAGGKLEHTGRTFMGLTRVGWLVGAVFAGAAPAIGLVAGLIAGLPSLMMTFAAAGGAIALGIDGIKKAAETVQPQFEALKAAISQQWQDGLTPIFQQLSALFPVFQTGMGQVTTGLLNMAQGITTTLTSAQGMQQLSTIFQGIGSFFTSITPQMQQFTNSFLTLGAAGANSLGHLKDFIAQFATQWQTMVDTVTSNGVFDSAMKGMSTALSGFTGLFTQLMQSGLGAMAKLGEPLNNMFSGLGNLLSAAMPALTAFSSGVANVIGNLGNSLAPAFAALEPAVTAIMPVFEQLATTLGTALSQAVVALAPGLTQLAQALGPVLGQALTAIAPLLGTLATNLGTLLLAAVQAITPFLPQLATAFSSLAQAIGAGLAQTLPLLVQAFTALLPVITPLIPVIIQLVQDFVQFVPAIFQVLNAVLQLVVALSPLLALLGKLVGLVGQVIAIFVTLAAAVVAKVAEMVAGVISWFANMVDTVVSKVSELIQKVPQFFSELPGKIKSALGDLGGLLVNAGKALMDGLLNGIKAGFEAVKNFVGGIAGWIADHKGPITYDKTVLVPNGEALMDGLNTGLENGFSTTMDNVKNMAKAIFEAIKEVFGSANGLALNLNFNGGGGGGGLVGGIGALSSQMAGATANAKDFQSTIAGAVNPATQLTADAKAQVNEYSRQLALLEQRRKELELMKVNDPKNEAIKQELELIRQQKLAIGLEKDKLTYAQKYEGTVSNTNDKVQEQIKKLTSMPLDFAKTTAQQAMSDFGISGNGALGAIADYGMELGSKFIFNVSNVDDAMALQQNQVQKQALGVVGR